jgi:hypothetical protein
MTGPVHNPYAFGRTTGGSSSGCACLVSGGEVDMALGADVSDRSGQDWDTKTLLTYLLSSKEARFVCLPPSLVSSG